MNNLIFYDFEVFYQDWLFVASLDDNFIIIHNKKSDLETFIKNHIDYWFVGYNNYRYDDLILSDILNGNNPYNLSKKIINCDEDDNTYYVTLLPNFKSLDLSQDIKRENNNKRISLKKVMGNLGMSIIESSVSFSIERSLTLDELETITKYCCNDVLGAKRLYDYRSQYFEAKFALIKDFNLPIETIKVDENKLVSLILKCKKYNEPRDYLSINYCNNINFKLIPDEVLDFYANIEYNYFNGIDYYDAINNSGNVIVKNKKIGKYKTKLLGVPAVYGFGGLHACTKARMFVNNIMQVDVKSYYPTLIINNHFYSRSFDKPELYDYIYQKRLKLKEIDEVRSDAYKLILNKVTGCMRSNQIMQDYHNGNNIVINGQLILTQLIIELGKYIILLQANTDSITFKYNPKNYDEIINIINDFENRFKLKFDKDRIKFLYQKNINNYFLITEDNETKFKGQDFKNYESNKSMYYSNSRSIISKCLVEYYKSKTPIEETVYKCYENNEIERFQLIVSYGKTYDKCFSEYNGQLIEQPQKVNRVFAVKDISYGYIYKCKKVDLPKKCKNIFEYNGTFYQREKMPNSYDHCYVFNDSVDKFDKSMLDLDYYINLCKKELR